MRDSGPPGLLSYLNVPPLIGTLVSGRMATLCELQTVYGIMDAYNLLEIFTVDRHNEIRTQQWQAQP
jgi:hypothetical protein